MFSRRASSPIFRTLSAALGVTLFFTGILGSRASNLLLFLADALEDLLLLLHAMVDQGVDLLDHTTELLLLRLQLVMQSVEDEHEAIKLFIF